MPSAPSKIPLDQAAVLAALRARVARLEGGQRDRHADDAIAVCEGVPLPGGGLARAAVHDVLAASPGCGAAFCTLLLARTGGTVLWIALEAEELRAWPPGLARFGLAPSRLVLVRAARWSDALWAMEEALRCPAVTGSVLAMPLDRNADRSPLDLTATRRLQLAAEGGGALGLLLRPDAAGAAPSATTSRWRVSAHPAIPEAGPDEGCWQLELLRSKTGRPGGPWPVRWHAATEQLVLMPAAARPAHHAAR